MYHILVYLFFGLDLGCNILFLVFFTLYCNSLTILFLVELSAFMYLGNEEYFLEFFHIPTEVNHIILRELNVSDSGHKAKRLKNGVLMPLNNLI